MSGGVKHDEGKVRYDLLPFDALDLVAQVFTFGANKYGDRNWEEGIERGRLVGAALRHITAPERGEYLDPESGLPHYAHALAGLLMLLALETRKRAAEEATLLLTMQADPNLWGALTTVRNIDENS